MNSHTGGILGLLDALHVLLATLPLSAQYNIADLCYWIRLLVQIPPVVQAPVFVDFSRLCMHTSYSYLYTSLLPVYVYTMHEYALHMCIRVSSPSPALSGALRDADTGRHSQT
jgi:hypothetical protein